MSGIISDNIGRSSGLVKASAGGGGIEWQSVVTASTLTAVAGNAYPINTTSNACTVTLPAAATVGDTIKFTDYARNWSTNALTLNPNSLNFQGNTSPNPVYNTVGQSITITYVDVTKGWIPTVDDDTTLETPQSYTCEYLCIAGGGSGRDVYGAGGGAGGYRNSYASENTGGGGSGETPLNFSPGTVYTITIGGGGAGGSADNGTDGTDGSIAGSDITNVVSDGGGKGSTNSASTEVGSNGFDGGSGGGAGSGAPGDGGSATANQGYDGGSALGIGSGYAASGGGGAGSAGGDNASSGNNGGNGGLGASSSITASAVIRAGGGGGSSYLGTVGYGNGGSGNDGGGGDGVAHNSGGAGNAGDANTGGAGGGGGNIDSAGGSGVIILRMDDADYTGTTSGSPTVATGVSGDTVLTFTGTGSYTA